MNATKNYQLDAFEGFIYGLGLMHILHTFF